MKVEWKVTKRDAHKRTKRERKKHLKEDRWEEYGKMVLERRRSEVLADMNKVMVDVGNDLCESASAWQENRDRWFTDEVRMSINERKLANKRYRSLRKTCGETDDRTVRTELGYRYKKDVASMKVAGALHVHKQVMKEVTKERLVQTYEMTYDERDGEEGECDGAILE